MNRYFLHWPSMVYAITIYGYNKKDALTRFKAQDQLDRMPNGFCIWEA